MKEELKIGVIGMGTMGTCLVRGLLESKVAKPDSIQFTTRHAESAHRAVELVPLVKSAKSNSALVQNAQIVILAIKPQNMVEVIKEIAPHLTSAHTLISIVAGFSTKDIERLISRDVAVVRAMPNTPALVREAITAICLGTVAEKKHQNQAETVFSSVGKVLTLDEDKMDAVTGLSGCGPAYVYVVLESLTDAGIKVGLSREVAQALASQTVLGAARMLMVTGKHPAALKDDVTTPAGCTIDGLMELEEGKLRVTLIKAVVQATRRARTLRLPEEG